MQCSHTVEWPSGPSVLGTVTPRSGEPSRLQQGPWRGLDEVEFAPEYPELAGKRVLITGVSGPLGVDVVRAFAEAGTRLVVQAVEDKRGMLPNIMRRHVGGLR